MSSYLNIYGRVNTDLYKIERIKDTNYQKQGDVILFDSYSRNNKIYQIMRDSVNISWAGDEEKYTTLTEENMNYCIDECNRLISNYRSMQQRDEKKKQEYLSYLHNLPKVINYEEFLNSIEDFDNNEELEEEIKECEQCLSQLLFIKDLVTTSSMGFNGFKEILCNID